MSSLVSAGGVLAGRFSRCTASVLGSSGGFFEVLPPDQHAADFRSTGPDLVQLGVAPQAPGRILVDVAVAAQNLDGFSGHQGGTLAHVQDCPRTIFPNRPHGLTPQTS